MNHKAKAAGFAGGLPNICKVLKQRFRLFSAVGLVSNSAETKTETAISRMTIQTAGFL
jgi:hypothetical protein